MEHTALRLLDERQTAQALSVSPAALRRWRREARGPAFIRCERCIRYDLREIESYLQQNSCLNKKTADLESAAKREARDGHATTRP